MIVCSCNVFSDADVRKCLDGAAAPRRAREVYRCLGYFPKCGVCVDTIRNIMEAERLRGQCANELADAAPDPASNTVATCALSDGG